MLGFVLRRLGESLLAVWGVVTIVFFVTRILGDPAALLLPIGASAQDIDALRAQLGLDQPLMLQYVQFLVKAVQGDFGTSFQHGRDAMQVVLERLPATATLALTAIALGLVIGGIAGSIAALKRGKTIEFIVMTFALLGQATPVFWLGIMLILFFGVNLGWLPTGGYGTLSHLILPAFTLAVFVSASIARLLRSSMLEILQEDYIRTAKAKGLLRHTVFVWHVARNALIPVVTMTAILTGELLGGSVVTETVFSWPGIGRLIIQAIEAKDFPVIQAGITLIAVIFVLINFLVDLLYGVLDPRIRSAR
ncbi:peptide/nickel transport system permease protein [Pacificibacter maritimus]|uniref:Peptide/nickel transport system permease protein n=1 Tax=Pacificibacter maritimus TaxID=762213 RepID=A0A3N4ULQ6_9RHOB|nr:ABC transporter permease [Pacificibacter maritimus]RPE70938.1 peptide/nickel transport system permease protein [Pacificibacter maritimus]